MRYAFECGFCKNDEGRQRVFEVTRPVAQSSDKAFCPDCGKVGERVYSCQIEKEFMAYKDHQWGVTVTSKRQEQSLMKSHGEIPGQETSAYKKFKSQVRLAKRKPVYFIPGTKFSKMERD